MKKIVKYIKEFFSTELDAVFLSGTALFLVVSIFINYYFQFEKNVLDPLKGGIVHFLAAFLYFGLPFFFTATFYLIRKKQFETLRSIPFYLTSIFCISILAFDESFLLYELQFVKDLPYDIRYFTAKIGNQVMNCVFYMTPFIFWKWFEKDKQPLYGFTSKGAELKPYLVMLLVMLPLITWASFQNDFLRSYPNYRPGLAEAYWGVSTLLTYSTYEITYGLNFVCLEFFFRGFMVLAFVRYLGKGAVFPMVAVYCYLHFGKPLGETIGSVFGGTILGIVAYYSRSILGGIIVHLGVAYLMDFTALYQHYFRDHQS